MAALLAFSLEAKNAAADEPTEIVVAAKPCDDGWRAFLDQLRVELAQDGVRVSLGDTEGKPRLGVDADACTETSTHATLTLGGAMADKRREVDLSSVLPSAKARVLALAAVELLRGALASQTSAAPNARSPIDLRLSLQAEPARATESATPSPPPEPPTPTPTFALVGEVRVVPETSAALAGPRASLLVPAGPLAFSLEAATGFGEAHAPGGGVDSLFVGGALGLGRTVGPSWLRVSLGAKLEVDYLLFKGISSTSSVRASSSGSPGALASLYATAYFALAPHAWGVVGIDGGETLYGYRALADGSVATGLLGPVVSVRLGVAFGANGP